MCKTNPDSDSAFNIHDNFDPDSPSNADQRPWVHLLNGKPNFDATEGED